MTTATTYSKLAYLAGLSGDRASARIYQRQARDAQQGPPVQYDEGAPDVTPEVIAAARVAAAMACFVGVETDEELAQAQETIQRIRDLPDSAIAQAIREGQEVSP